VTEQKVEGHRWFAAIYDRLMGAKERSAFMRGVREEIAGGAKGRVLEVGCGTGFNLPYYSDKAEQLVVTEPDPYMLARARKRAAELGRPIDIQQAPAEELPFDDGSFDTVVSTLVLCSVGDPGKALAEVRRVLKPSGEFRFYEHVRYAHAFGAFWQDLITPVWRWFGAGCHPNRDLERSVRDAGFNILELEHPTPYPPIPPMAFARPHIKGVATPA
jgi:ubiquinone/menaquinone biosynthesis C-methylase UbiE